jgi:hypothetical protein
MTDSNSTNQVDVAAHELNQAEDRSDGARVATGLSNGLGILCTSVYDRIHHDVETKLGKDSLMMPLSELKAKQRTSDEIEIYQIAEAGAAARHFGYISGSDDWCLQWLARLRLGDRGQDPNILDRVHNYFAEPSENRVLVFGDALVRVMPEARRAPLILFRLVPLAVQVAMACAFGDHDTAASLRRQQAAIQPAITDCRQCRARLLACEEQCRACGNPLWKYEWLESVD